MFAMSKTHSTQEQAGNSVSSGNQARVTSGFKTRRRQKLGLQLGVAFSILVLIFIATGVLDLIRMDRNDALFNEVLGRRAAKLQLIRQAMEYSSRNSRITLQIFKTHDKSEVERLLAQRAENSVTISSLITQIDIRCDTEEEKQLLAAVKEARKVYVETYANALHLLVNESQPDAATAVMTQKTTPALLTYHALWDEFARFQMKQMDQAAQQNRAEDVAASRFILVLLVLATIAGCAIAFFVTRQIVIKNDADSREAKATQADLENQLNRSEERLGFAMEAAGIGFWDWDLIKNEQVWSDTSKALLGLAAGSRADFEVLKQRVHPDDWGSLWDEIQKAIEEKNGFAVEFRVVWPDGTVHWQTGHGRAFYDKGGRPIRMAGVAMDIDKQKTTEEKLHLQVAALEAAANSVVITEPDGKIVWTNKAFSELTGYSAEEARGQNPRLLRSGKQDKSFYADLWRTVKAGKVWRGQMINRRKDGSFYTEEQVITPVRSRRGDIANFVAIKQDVSERERTLQELSDREDRLRLILESTAEAIYGTDLEGRCTFCNPACVRLLGYESQDELLGKNMHHLTHRSRNEGSAVDPNQCRIDQALMGGQGVHADDGLLWKADGTSFPAEYWSYPQWKGDDIVGAVVAFLDISQRKAADERIRSLAYYDAVTGLPNRVLLQDRLTQAIANAVRRGDKVGFLFLDVDHFKNINDSLGHSVGDLLLKEVAERLKKLVRKQDTVSRLGGDEFVVVLADIKSLSDAEVTAGRIVDVLCSEFLIQGTVLNVSCSMGVTLFPDHGRDAETLAKHADAAMYCAKENGRNNFRVFSPAMNAQVVERLTLENSLRTAFQKRELFLMYQPQVDTAITTLTGVEALVRWSHPERGMISPEKFIPIAEASGLIVPLGEWVLHTACAQAREWQRQGLPKVPVAVNVSAMQFRQLGFLQLVKRVLRETGLEPQYLELELTETLILSNADVMLSLLQELKDMGIKLSIDDFGTGYSSLSYLRQFPVSKLKIDRSFVQHVEVDPDNDAITGAIISMAKSLKLKVIAEGVETDQQMGFLRSHQCDEIQGYYFSKPLLAEEFLAKVQGALRGPAVMNGGAMPPSLRDIVQTPNTSESV